MLSTRVAVRHAGLVSIGVVVIAVIAIAASGILKSDEPVDEPMFICRAEVAKPEAPMTAPLEVLTNDVTESNDRPVCSCSVTVEAGRTVEERRTLELACRLYSDERCAHEFSVFATPRHGDRTAVVVRRSTGDCGGCGALTVAATFDRGALDAIGELGRYGRFGNGPDAVRWVDVAGEPALVVTESTSMGGYTDEYREYFLRDGDGFRSGLCVLLAHDDRGARENYSAWKAHIRERADGALDIRYRTIKRGEAKPTLTPVTIGFDRKARRWVHDRSDDWCFSPPRPDLIDL